MYDIAPASGVPPVLMMPPIDNPKNKSYHASIKINYMEILRGGVQFPTGGKARESVKIDPVKFRSRQ